MQRADGFPSSTDRGFRTREEAESFVNCPLSWERPPEDPNAGHERPEHDESPLPKRARLTYEQAVDSSSGADDEAVDKLLSDNDKLLSDNDKLLSDNDKLLSDNDKLLSDNDKAAVADSSSIVAEASDSVYQDLAPAVERLVQLLAAHDAVRITPASLPIRQ
jgi:hypothetical protein